MSRGLTPEMVWYDPFGDDLPETELEKRALTIETGVPLTGAVTVGEVVAATFGDGSIRFFRPNEEIISTQAHNGAVLCVVADACGVLTGGDDGRFLRIFPDGKIEEIATFGSRWVDCVAACVGRWACSSGKYVHIWRQGEAAATSLEHVSTIGGLAFDASGERLAVAHYGGVTLWELNGRSWTRSQLNWKGSHGAVSFSPNDRYLVSTMQENALHGWRLVDGMADMAMAGYPAKVKNFAWAGDTPHLVTSGAEELICWPFDGPDGPMGRSPLCLARCRGNLVTCVQSLNTTNAAFSGFRDGLVLLSELNDAKELVVVRRSTGSEVTAIAVTSSFSHLLIGDTGGTVFWTRFWLGGDHVRNV
ncbi:MAG: WD40 repeat domain-containing protein [Aestuariivita sp.]|nr:WD40 repeat domain-containing protein [Aestuariivita sp.]MCY4346689.1 WD40 repeat domain-containing protein [Aestuariivita sp.]